MGAMAYLEPSYERAKQGVASLSPALAEQLPLIHDLILNHHKITPVEGHSRHAALVEAVRKADTTDFTLGLIRFGIKPGDIAFLKRALPNAGFHKALLRFSFSAKGYQIPLGIMKW